MIESTLFNHHAQSNMPEVQFNQAKFFWSWFQDNANYMHQKLFTQTAVQDFSYWLQVNLNYYCKGLGFKIALANKTNPKHQIWFSCNGNPAYYKAITNLVDNSPNLTYWKVYAFIPKNIKLEDFNKKLQDKYQCNGININLKHVLFRASGIAEPDKRLKLKIFVKNYELHHDKQELEKQVYSMFKDVLGEVHLFQIIHSANIYPYPKRLAVNKSGLLPLHKLVEVYELLVNKKV